MRGSWVILLIQTQEQGAGEETQKGVLPQHFG